MIEAFLKLTSVDNALADLSVAGFDWPVAPKGATHATCAFYAFDGDLNRWVLAHPANATLRIDMDVQRILTVLEKMVLDRDDNVVTPAVIEDRGLHANLLFTGQVPVVARKRLITRYRTFTKYEVDTPQLLKDRFKLRSKRDGVIKRVVGLMSGNKALRVKEARMAANGTKLFEPTAGDDVAFDQRKFGWAA